ncbi:MAG: mechanosensitive ion channel family protein [Acidiferrobacterales bacterium]|nr:mechanosensitive ion channel family protein [Acidiferrobacterales bacterium]
MDQFSQTLRGYLGVISGDANVWIVEVFIIVLLTLVAALVALRVAERLARAAEKTKTLWDDALFASLRRPLSWFIWLMGLSSAAQIAGAQSNSIILNSVEHVRYLGAIFVVTWFLTRFISRVEKNFMDPEYCQKPMDQTTAVAIGKLLRIAVIITAALIILQYFEVQISGILAFGGIGGIAVGFAAKDLLANFFGGLMIYLDRPFSVGDWVRSHDKEIEGTVEDIGWRLTRIRTFDKRPLYIPNSTFTQIAVENPSRMTNRRIYETIGVRYDDASAMELIVNDVKKMLKEHEAIDQKNTLMVNFNAFASSSLDFFIYCFTRTTDWAEFHEIKQDVLLKILAIIDSHGAECAFPTQTVHVAELPQPDKA